MATSKLTSELVDAFVERLRAGDGFEAAARAVGISERTAQRWRARGMGEENGAYATFARAVELARRPLDPEAETEGLLVDGELADEVEDVLVEAMVRAAKKGSWRAAAWLLERAFPANWGTATERWDDAPEPSDQAGL